MLFKQIRPKLVEKENQSDYAYESARTHRRYQPR